MASPIAETKSSSPEMKDSMAGNTAPGFFVKVEENPKFKQLMKEKKSFIASRTVLFLAIYFGLPILAAFTTLLHKPFFKDISWVWIYSLAQFIMTWVLCMVYMKRAARFDEQVEEVLEEELKDGGMKA